MVKCVPVQKRCNITGYIIKIINKEETEIHSTMYHCVACVPPVKSAITFKLAGIYENLVKEKKGQATVDHNNNGNNNNNNNNISNNYISIPYFKSISLIIESSFLPSPKAFHTHIYTTVSSIHL